MDEFLKNLLKEKNKINSLDIDGILGKIHKRTLFMMVSLSKVQLKLENANKPDAPCVLSLGDRKHVKEWSRVASN